MNHLPCSQTNLESLKSFGKFSLTFNLFVIVLYIPNESPSCSKAEDGIKHDCLVSFLERYCN